MAELVKQVKEVLSDIQQSLFNAAKQKREACIKVVNTWDEFIVALSEKKLILAPWCDEEVCVLITGSSCLPCILITLPILFEFPFEHPKQSTLHT